MYHCLICRKKSCKKIPEYDKWFNKDQTAHNREDQTYPQDFSASVKLPGRVILAGKGGSCLTESSNHVIGKIFKVHGNGTACNCRRAKAVHRGLYKDIGKAEYSTLDGRRDSHFKKDHIYEVQMEKKKYPFSGGRSEGAQKAWWTEL